MRRQVGWNPSSSGLGSGALDDLAPGAELGNAFDGHLWRLPLVADMGLLYWRTDLMPEPPQTPEQLVAISQQLQRAGKVRWGYVWQGRQYEGLSCVVVELLQGAGGRWLDQGQPQLNSAAARNVSRWLRDLVTLGITPPSVANMSEADALQTFETGDAAFMRNWPYAWAELKQTRQQAGRKGGHHDDGECRGGTPRRHPRQLGFLTAQRFRPSVRGDRGAPLPDQRRKPERN